MNNQSIKYEQRFCLYYVFLRNSVNIFSEHIIQNVCINKTDLKAIYYLLRCLFCQVLQTWTWGESLTVIRNWETSWLLLDPSSNLVVHFFFIFHHQKTTSPYCVYFTNRLDSRFEGLFVTTICIMKCFVLTNYLTL